MPLPAFIRSYTLFLPSIPVSARIDGNVKEDPDMSMRGVGRSPMLALAVEHEHVSPFHWHGRLVPLFIPELRPSCPGRVFRKWENKCEIEPRAGRVHVIALLRRAGKDNDDMRVPMDLACKLKS